MSGSRRNKIKEKITYYKLLFLLKHGFTTHFVPLEAELTAMLHHGSGIKCCKECFNLNEKCCKREKNA